MMVLVDDVEVEETNDAVGEGMGVVVVVGVIGII